jgi:hypothetical protein
MDTRIEPIELTDDELKAVAGGSNFTFTNSTIVGPSATSNNSTQVAVAAGAISTQVFS